MKSLKVLILLFVIGQGLATATLANERLNLLKSISAAGAPALTLKMLDQTQPKVDADLYEWILWEQERFVILSEWKQWDDLLLRIENLPADIPEQFKHQAATYKVLAYLELGQADSARQILRGLLWQVAAGNSSEYETWRQQLIVTYIQQDRIDDARIALLRFDQDFDNQSLDWLLLRVTVLLKSERYDQVIQMLKSHEAWQAKLTLLLARYLSGQIRTSELWKTVVQLSKAESSSEEELATIWALGYRAALDMSPVDRVVALESLLQISTRTPLEIFDVPVDALWQAYFDYAELVGNRAELLVGQDRKWLQLAEKGARVTPSKSRSLYALLIARSADSEIVDLASEGYLRSFANLDQARGNLLTALFIQSKSYSDVDQIPVLMRYQLVDQALTSADIAEATRLMSGLNTMPKSANKFDWQLRQARILILGGRYDEGNQVLSMLLEEYQQADVESTDRILQVLFDLQTVNYHQQAIQYFGRLLSLEIEPKQRREILYWIADSYNGLEEFDRAALLYLQSAMLPGPETLDPWAQTARFNAAVNLEKSGYIDDARRIYLGLLKVTREPARRSVLNQKVQQLWLNQASQQ